LAELTRDTRRRLAPFRRAQFRLFGRVARSFAEHEAVLAAVRDGDGERARRAMHAHMVVVGGASADYVAGRRAAEAAPEDPGTGAD
jgi:DNA-binding GntR family transcriptional regulator